MLVGPHATLAHAAPAAADHAAAAAAAAAALLELAWVRRRQSYNVTQLSMDLEITHALVRQVSTERENNMN